MTRSSVFRSIGSAGWKSETKRCLLGRCHVKRNSRTPAVTSALPARRSLQQAHGRALLLRTLGHEKWRPPRAGPRRPSTIADGDAVRVIRCNSTTSAVQPPGVENAFLCVAAASVCLKCAHEVL
eukprot:2802213-Prymnesium_polylepis.2